MLPFTAKVEAHLEAAFTLTKHAEVEQEMDGDGFALVSTSTSTVGAYSNLSIPSGKNGYVEATVGPELTGDWRLGLTSDPALTGLGHIDFGLQTGAFWTVWENGTQVYTSAALTVPIVPEPGDRARVAVEGTEVRYFVNGVLLYTSAATPTFPLFLNAIIYTTRLLFADVVATATVSGFLTKVPSISAGASATVAINATLTAATAPPEPTGLMRSVRMVIWTDLSRDVLNEVALEYGLKGATPTDLVAPTGTLRFTMNNSKTNTAGTLGLYSPENAAVRTGWKVGIPIRYSIEFEGVTYYKFVGLLDEIEVVPGIWKERTVACTAVDWLDGAARIFPIIPTLIDLRSDHAVRAVIASVTPAPNAVRLDPGDSTFPFLFDNSRSESQTALTELQRIAQSEPGRIFIKGDTLIGGVLTYKRRLAFLAQNSLATFDDTMMSMSAPQRRSDVLNVVKVVTHPREVITGPPSLTLFRLTSPVQVSPNQTVNISGNYSDPESGGPGNSAGPARVGGIELQLGGNLLPGYPSSPPAGEPFTANTQADGLGADVTDDFELEPVLGGNSCLFQITNFGSVVAYVTKLEVIGRGLYDFNPTTAIQRSEDSIMRYGEATISVDMPYQGNTLTADAVAKYVLSIWKAPRAQEVTLGFIAFDAASLTQALAREPSDVITIKETVTGISTLYRIQGVTLRVKTGFCEVEWLTARATVGTGLPSAYWTLVGDTYSIPNQSTLPGPSSIPPTLGTTKLAPL